MRRSVTYIIILFPFLLFSQQDKNLWRYAQRIAPSAGTMMLAGGMNAVMDNIENAPKYRQTIFEERWPMNEFQYGQWWGCKCDTWVNKWDQSSSGNINVGIDRFPFSSFLLVGLTDQWHGFQTGYLASLRMSIILYEPPGRQNNPWGLKKWQLQLLDFAVLSAAHGIGFHAGQMLIKRRD
jgi:hypothetical protein